MRDIRHGPCRRLVLSICIIILSLSAVDARAADPDVISREAITPKGERYWAVVPDTLDLAERARLMVHGLTSFLEPDTFTPYCHGFFNLQPPFQTDYFSVGAMCWGKIAEAMIMTRLMSGSMENLDIEEQSLRGMIAFIDEDINVTPESCIMLALMDLHQLRPDPALVKTMAEIAEIHRQRAKISGDMAYTYGGPPTYLADFDNKIGQTGYLMDGLIQGRAVRSLARYYDVSGDKSYLDLAIQFKNYFMQPKHWEPEAEPKVVVSAEHAHFKGEFHSYTQFYMGCLWLVELTGDMHLAQFVRDGYEYLRNLGIARIGLLGETCSTGDMIYIAAKLSDLGIGDYWEDVDCYVRNQLAEAQITDTKLLKEVVATMPKAYHDEPALEDTSNTIDRHLGLYLSDGAHPTRIPAYSLVRVICCQGNPPLGLYVAWEGIVRCQDDAAQVNLLLNRASPWLDIDSYLPYEGKVVIRNKTAKRISVRIPMWVNETAVKCKVNGKKASMFWIGRYLVFDNVAGKDAITIEFPVVETQETYTLKWKDSDFWFEGTSPSYWWEPKPTLYTLTMRGNTLVDINPRSKGPGYPLYQRDEMKADQAPMIERERFVSTVIPKW